MIQRRPFFLTFLAPAVLTAVILAAALFEVLQYSVREFVPGSLNVGGLTFENFTRINRPIYWWVLLDTFYISLLTAIFSLLLSYPVAYALVRAKRDWVRSLLVSLSIQPLAVDRIRVRWTMSAYGDELTQDELETRIALWHEVNREDREKLEKMQRALSSRHAPSGPLAPRDYEGTIWDFYRYLGRQLPADAPHRERPPLSLASG